MNEYCNLMIMVCKCMANKGIFPRRNSVVVRATSQRTVVILPGLGNNSADYEDLKSLLNTRYEYIVHVARVSRLDWARNARGLLDSNYWAGSLSPRPTVDWYLDRVDEAVQKSKKTSSGPITLLCHSAGGWLGRLYLRDFDRAGITHFVSLGSPHLPPPEGVVDQTRGILTHIQNTCPHAYHDDISYVTIAGKYVRGAELFSRNGSFADRMVGVGYKQVCGQSAVDGDGVVPIPSAHLKGATQINLDDVYHSPLGATKIGGTNLDSDDYEESPGLLETQMVRRWYGHPENLEKWVEYLK